MNVRRFVILAFLANELGTGLEEKRRSQEE
jgi:hypothetical protein